MITLILTLKVIAHWVRNVRMRFSIFSYFTSFSIQMHATDAKTQKIEPDPNFFMMMSYLFFNVQKVSDSVYNDLNPLISMCCQLLSLCT